MARMRSTVAVRTAAVTAAALSTLGYLLVGDTALHRGDPASARTAYFKAFELLRSRGDGLYAAVATEHSLVSTIEAIEARIRALD